MGLAVALELVEDGWTVVVSGRRADVLDKAAARLHQRDPDQPGIAAFCEVLSPDEAPRCWQLILRSDRAIRDRNPRIARLTFVQISQRSGASSGLHARNAA
jgi:NAD(P)-dependent dehydrogenase (short-subunit alcohol dehydrogenase family)